MLDDHGFGDVEVVAVENRYFGGNIKVAGLLTGFDIARTLETLPVDATVLLPDVCLSEGRFLDGLGLEDLPRSVTTVTTTGNDLRETLERVRPRNLVSS